MRLFALQTNVNTLAKRFCEADEKVHHITRYHGLAFLGAIVKNTFLTVLIAAAAGAAIWFAAPIGLVLSVAAGMWFVLVFFSILRAYLDWSYDVIIITSEKVIFVDQTSIFHRSITPVHVDNIGAIHTETQFANLLPFGILKISLKQGENKEFVRDYVPDVEQVAAAISSIVTQYQRSRGQEAATTPPSFDATP